MSAFKSEDYYIHLGSGLYLNATGQVVDKLPKTDSYIVDRLPIEINFPDFIKKSITDKNVKALPGTIKGLADMAGGLGIDPKVWQILEASLNLLFNLTSVTGAAGAAVNLARLLLPGSGGQPSQLTVIGENVQKLLNMEYKGHRQAVMVSLAQDWAVTQGARAALNDFLLDESPGILAFQALNAHAEKLYETALKLLHKDYQKLTKMQDDYSGQPWYTDRSWLVSRSGAPLEPSADIARMTDPEPRWDYTPYLAAIIDIVTLLLAIYKTLDPANRTTGRFHYRADTLAKLMKSFGERIGEHIVWTREWTTSDHYWRPMDYGWPVGAVDVCSGKSVFKAGWPALTYTPPPPIGNPNDPPPLPKDMAGNLAAARVERDLSWLIVYEASGALRVLQLASVLEEMATVPKSSETLQPVVSKTTRRTRTGSLPRSTPSLPHCEAVTFTAAVYEVKRSIRVNCGLQTPKRHPEEKGYWPIPYKFFVESHPGRFASGTPLDRVELKPGMTSLTLRAQVFDWEVKSKKVLMETSPNFPTRWEQLVQDRYVILANTRPDLRPSEHPWSLPDVVKEDILDSISQDPDFPGVVRNVDVQPVTIDCSLVRRKADFTARFWNRPGQLNYSGVYLVIEEGSRMGHPQGGSPGPILRTMVEISMIGKELHLPLKYFELIELCESRARAIIKEIEQVYRLKAKPIPRWDPVAFANPAEWVQQVMREQPKVLKGALLKEARGLARNISKPPRNKLESG